MVALPAIAAVGRRTPARVKVAARSRSRSNTAQIAGRRNPRLEGCGIDGIVIRKCDLLSRDAQALIAALLYERAGFLRIAPSSEYVGSPLSVCMAKDL